MKKIQVVSEIAKLFLRFGALGFGGPIAVIAMMEEEVCRRRKWISPQKFSETYAILKVMPGPISSQMAIFLGRLRGGGIGGIVAGLCFILPAFLFVLGLSWFYVAYGGAGRGMAAFLPGFQAGAIVVIVFSMFQLFKPYRKRKESLWIALASAGIVLMTPRWEGVAVLGFGLLGAILVGRRKPPLSFHGASQGPSEPEVKTRELGSRVLALGGAAALGLDPIYGRLFWTCLKAGAFLFGTGFAIVPMLEGEVVRLHGWLNHAEFMDGLAIGQMTPGPVVITATFIGYKAAGIGGALAATAGIFLPSFVNVLLILPRLWRRIEGSPRTENFAAWAFPAVVGGIGATVLRMGFTTLGSIPSAASLLISILIALRFRWPAWALIPASGVWSALISILLNL